MTYMALEPAGAPAEESASAPRRTYLRVPERRPTSRLRLGLNLLASAVLVPWYWSLAAIRSGPGLRYRARCIRLGIQLMLLSRDRDSAVRALRLILMPMDSTRYLEFEYAERMTTPLPTRRYLDVSSPRLVPVLLALERRELSVMMINPDVRDLEETRALLTAAGLATRCETRGSRIADATLDAGSFDLITCISVLEHIPDDTGALAGMQAMLRSGGTLVLTVPCMSQALEQFIDEDEYGLLPQDNDGFVFWQRYYDARSLRERVYSILGQPDCLEVYGEKRAGSFARNAEQKRRLGPAYPFWREPYMMATEYRRFASIEELPGEGVACMTFVRK